MNHIDSQNLLIFGGVLFAIGLIGFLTRRSLILMFLSLETMLSGVSLNLIVFRKSIKTTKAKSWRLWS